MSSELLQQAGRRLESWARTLLLTHRRPDGDALGAIGAMKRVILAGGRTADAQVDSLDLGRYAFLHESIGFKEWDPAAAGALSDRFDGILVLDTCSWSQLELYADFLRSTALPKIVVDHHATGDKLSGNGGDDLYIIDPHAASACVMVYRWCRTMGWPIDAQAADAIFAGLVTDTGWFRFSNTDTETFQAAAELVAQGIQPHRVYAELYESLSPQRLYLKSRMLQTLELLEDNTLAVMTLTKEMFEQTGAKSTDSEDLVNEPMQAGTVLVTVLLTDMGDGEIRANFRSKAPEVCGRDIDVSAVAKQFGGGGHRRAAGARLEATLEESRNRILEAVVPMMRQQG